MTVPLTNLEIKLLAAGPWASHEFVERFRSAIVAIFIEGFAAALVEFLFAVACFFLPVALFLFAIEPFLLFFLPRFVGFALLVSRLRACFRRLKTRGVCGE